MMDKFALQASQIADIYREINIKEFLDIKEGYYGEWHNFNQMAELDPKIRKGRLVPYEKDLRKKGNKSYFYMYWGTLGSFRTRNPNKPNSKAMIKQINSTGKNGNFKIRNVQKNSTTWEMGLFLKYEPMIQEIRIRLKELNQLENFTRALAEKYGNDATPASMASFKIEKQGKSPKATINQEEYSETESYEPAQRRDKLEKYEDI